MPRTLPLRALAPAALLALAAPAALRAQPIGPVYPPPGGVSFVGTGSSIGAGGSPGRLNRYTGFDDATYSRLYWTVNAPIANPKHSSQGATGSMTYAGFDAATGIATWTSSANMAYATASGPASYATRLRLQFQPHTGINAGPLASGWLMPVTASAAGIPTLPSAWPTLVVKGGPAAPTPFQVWYRFETAGGQALGPHYDGTHSLGGSIQTSIGGGFYFTPAPEPATWATLGAGLLAVAGVARRRRR